MTPKYDEGKMRHFFVVFLFILLLPGVASAFAISEYAGTWMNTDSQTRGITRIEIAEVYSKAGVHTWGKCTPKDCNWGCFSVLGLETGPDKAKCTEKTRVYCAENGLHYMIYIKYKGIRI